MIYLLTGMWRSGTSAWMEGCEAGGMNVVDCPQRTRFNENHGDEDYKPNPERLFEPHPEEMRKLGFPRQHDGWAIKLVCPFILRGRLAAHEYRCVFMRRDSEEIRQSAEASFNIKASVEYIEECVHEAMLMLKVRKDVLDVMELWYDDFLADPASAYERCGWPLDVEKAVAKIDKSRKRFHKEKLVVGL